jgi:hypothetical protein
LFMSPFLVSSRPSSHRRAHEAAVIRVSLVGASHR